MKKVYKIWRKKTFSYLLICYIDTLLHYAVEIVVDGLGWRVERAENSRRAARRTNGVDASLLNRNSSEDETGGCDAARFAAHNYD